jgi:hypothetical protein
MAKIRHWKLKPRVAYPKFDLIREDGRLERICEHGIGHTVGHCDPTECLSRHTWIHGCDGCCHLYMTMAPEKFEGEK